MTIYQTFSNHRNKKIHEVSKPIVENNFKTVPCSLLEKNDNNITRNSGFLLIFIILTVKHSYFHLLSEISKTFFFQILDYSGKTQSNIYDQRSLEK